jgi:hypothetical protein
LAKSDIPTPEMQAFKQARLLQDLASRIAEETGEFDLSRQFRDDFEALAFSITDPDWHKAPKPHNNPKLPPYRTHALPRRLPFGPLRRMARLIGPQSLRYLFQVGSDQGADYYRIELRPRLDKEHRTGSRHKRFDHEFDVIEFGNLVLRIERNDSQISRGAALEAAANRLRIPASGRTLERRFQDFRRLCERAGYVVDVWQRANASPEFSLADIDARPSDKSQK